MPIPLDCYWHLIAGLLEYGIKNDRKKKFTR